MLSIHLDSSINSLERIIDISNFHTRIEPKSFLNFFPQNHNSNLLGRKTSEKENKKESFNSTKFSCKREGQKEENLEGDELLEQLELELMEEKQAAHSKIADSSFSRSRTKEIQEDRKSNFKTEKDQKESKIKLSCNHEAKHYAKNLCKQCYQQYYFQKRCNVNVKNLSDFFKFKNSIGLNNKTHSEKSKLRSKNLNGKS